MKIRSFTFAVLIATSAVWAQQQQQQSQDDEGPGRGVARISLMNGDVSVKRGDTGDLIAATINSPLMVSDRVLTGPGSRAELQFDSANLLRMAETAEVRMTELEWQKYMIQIAAGTVTFRVIRDNSQAQIELNTPSVALRPVKRGEYRITVREDGTTEITVRSGELEIFTQRGSERLKSGRTMLARGTAADPEFQVVAAAARDDFDRWNQDRDRYFERSESYGQMSSDIYGGEDLDNSGSWVNYPQYGRVWVPRVNAGWAPYRDGRWVYYDWYGWTWVSSDSWGWAPYHYGRWFHDTSFGWAWWPGGVGQRHYWRPAFVSFFGWGGNGGYRSGIGFGFGNVGWVPLAPYEPCYGWWGRNRYNGWRNNGFQNNTTIVNNVNITNIYRNARVQNGITSVGSGDFGRNRIHDGNRVNARVQDLQGAGVVRGNLPLVPERGVSGRLSDREPRAGGYARTTEDSRAFRTREPARVDRVSFDDQRRGTEELARRSFDRPTRVDAVATPNGGDRTRAGDSNNNGWRRAGETVRGNATVVETPDRGVRGNSDRQNNADGTGWRRFGDTQRGGSGTPASLPPTVDGGGSRRDGRTAVDDNSVVVRRGDAGGRNTTNNNNNRSRDTSRDATTAEDGWRRFGGSRSTDSAPTPPSDNGSRNRERVNPNPEGSRGNREASPDRGSFGRSGNDAPPRVERQERQERQRSAEPVRISPPIVRERSTPSGNDGGGGNRGGGERSAPRMERNNSGGDSSPRGGGGNGGGGGGNGGGGGSRGGDSGGASRSGDGGGRGSGGRRGN